MQEVRQRVEGRGVQVLILRVTMPIKGKCDKCGTEFSAKDSFAGRTVKCRGCGNDLRIPPPKPGGGEVEKGPEAPGEPSKPEDTSVKKPCPNCSRLVAGDQKNAGKNLQCPFCHQKFHFDGLEFTKGGGRLAPPGTRCCGEEIRRRSDRAADLGGRA
jgi:DNA-directed RNA polymerase subunit RPC12/RpoP